MPTEIAKIFRKSISASYVLMLLFATFFTAIQAQAQTAAFTYQGKLTDGGAAANGPFDFAFLLCADASSIPCISSPVSRDDVQVNAGVFTVNLDFGTSPFASDTARFLEIFVRPGASTGGYTTLSPRQPLTSSPFSIRTLSANAADSLSAACVLCVTDGQIIAIDGAKVIGTVANATTADNVSGIISIANGGTGSPTKNFIDLTNEQRVSGDKEFTGAISVIEGGRFFGDGSGLTNVPAVIADGSVTTPKLADGSVTKAKLAVNFRNGFDPQMVAQMRWDQIPVVPHIADVGRNPAALAFDGTFMYVANKLDNNVMRIRTSTGLIEGSPIPVGNAPAALVYDGFRSVWVANSGAGTVSRISIQNAAVDMTIPVGSQPCSLGFDGNLIYVGDCNSNQVTRVTKDGAVVGASTVGHKTVSFAFDGTYMYVAEPFNQSNGANGNVRRILASTGAVETIPGSITAGSLAFDGTFIYAAVGLAVRRIRASTGVRESSNIHLSSPLSLTSVALVFDGTFLYGSGFDSSITGAIPNAVVKLNINGLRSEPNAIPAQGSVTALAFDGTYTYAAADRTFTDINGNSVTINGVVTRF